MKRDHFVFVFASISLAAVHFFFSIYAKRIISPYEYGIFSACMLIQTYMTYFQSGALNAFNRDYPQLIGASKTEEAIRYQNVVFTFLLLVGTILVLISGMVAYFCKLVVGADSRYSIGLFLCAVLTSVTMMEQYANYRARIDKGFYYVGSVMLLEMFASLSFLYLIPRMGYYSLYVFNIIAMLVGVISFFCLNPVSVKIILDFGLLKTIIATGLPLLISGFMWTLQNSIDKTIIIGFIGIEGLGLYGIAQNAFSYMILIPAALSQVYYAEMGREYGERGSARSLVISASKHSASVSVMTGFMAVIAYYMLPKITRWIMPEYIGGIRAAQVLIVGLTIYASTMVFGNILSILKKNRIILGMSATICLLNALISGVMVYVLGKEIAYVAIGTGISYAINSFAILLIVSRIADYSFFKLAWYSIGGGIVAVVPGVIIYEMIPDRLWGMVLSVLLLVMVSIVLYTRRLDY